MPHYCVSVYEERKQVIVTVRHKTLLMKLVSTKAY